MALPLKLGGEASALRLVTPNYGVYLHVSSTISVIFSIRPLYTLSTQLFI
jgi:hypothetical protein